MSTRERQRLLFFTACKALLVLALQHTDHLGSGLAGPLTATVRSLFWLVLRTKVPGNLRGISSQNNREKGLTLPFLKRVIAGILRKPITGGWTILHTARCPLMALTQVSSVAWRCSPWRKAHWAGSPPIIQETEAPDRVTPWYSVSLAQRNEGTDQHHRTLTTE